MIYLCCCYVSSRRPSDAGSTVTKCSCTLLIIGHTEPKSVYFINSLHASVLCWKLLQGTYKYPNQTWHNVELSGHYDGIPETVL